MSDTLEFRGAGQPNGVEIVIAPAVEQPSSFDLLRDRLRKSFIDMRSLLAAIRAPLPTQTGDGTYLPIPPPISTGDDLEAVLRDIGALGHKNIESLADVVRHAKLQQPINDKQYLMEYLIRGAACLEKDIVSMGITNSFLETLWSDIQHPPQMLLDVDFFFRQPDGSKNNYAVPQIGAAGTPYARTVTPRYMRAGALPDPGLVFDAVMGRRAPEEHPNKISSMLFYLASIIIHDCFKTNRHNYNVSDSSSYLDLAPLYGSNWEEQKKMRTFRNGRIKPDCFSETRLLTFPPGVGALLIMFNRHHNHVVEQLALINEDGRFTDKGAKVDRYGQKGLDKRDDDLFQTGRLVTCGLYVNIILIDYVRTILNLNRTDENWQLNPRVDIPDGPAFGTGNQVSCEFNLVYRWHASVSARDERWTEQLYDEMFKSGDEPIDPSLPSPQDFHRILQKMKEFEQAIPADPPTRPWPALKSDVLKRDKNGRYDDNELAEILTSGIEDCANAMGPRRVPKVMKFIEVLGIVQARTWKVATLNEFRRHFALEPHRTFESITNDTEVAQALKYLYDTPDNVELYPGLVVEDAKKPMLPGSGLCPSYTVSRAVLSDAVALVRGDRYYTISYSPSTMTNWGYQEASSDLAIDNGCVFYKLFLRALPKNYDPASIYIHYPLTIPQGENGMKDILGALGKAHKYSFQYPTPIAQPSVLFTYDACIKVLDNPQAFRAAWGKPMEFLMGKAAKNFMLAGDGPRNVASRNLMTPAMYLGADPFTSSASKEHWYTAVKTFYEDLTIKLLSENSHSIAGTRQLDIIRDVGNLAHVHFAAEMFSLPLKTADFPHGIFTEQELYLILSAIFVAVFFDADPVQSFPLRQSAYEATQSLGKILEVQVAAIAATGQIAEGLIEYVKPTARPLKGYGVHMIAQLFKQDHSIDDLVWGNIMPTLGGVVAPQAMLFGQIIDFYLCGEGAKYMPEIQRLALADTPEADDTLLHYVMEGIRLNGESGAMRRVEKETTIEDKTGLPHLPTTHHFKPGDEVLLNFKAASRDPKAFPKPNDVVLTRPLDSYITFGHGTHRCLGLPMTQLALTTMFKTVMKLPGLKPAIVSVGGVPQTSRVKKVAKEFGSVGGGGGVEVPESWKYCAFLTEDWDVYFPFPTSLKVTFTDESSGA
ncbi:heme peroxidase [Neohortaea acidophila]|uniref:linoleate 8R-lipoxygenase n=1 Tax=Neohortaea acidophila TaxID=245834 RepID=A0A6A6PGM2_9PEZI|nr:heme peroxidase [Neohortaea acidophila]KAF2479065.1 heme peroxidase [Neohortaea acidophila]